MNVLASMFEQQPVPQRMRGRVIADRSELLKAELRKLGRHVDIAKRVGITPMTITHWIIRGWVPEKGIKKLAAHYEIDEHLLRRQR